MFDATALKAAVDAAVAQADKTKTTEAGAAAILRAQADTIKKAVLDAIATDDAADQGTADAVTAAINTVTAGFAASAGDLGDAVANVAGTPAA